MGQKNRRVTIVGIVLVALAMVFFLFMLSIASKSTDPVALMQIVGTVSGVVAGLGVTIIVIGTIGRKT
ncbi:MAG: hypothetical protein U1F34_02515 [Gammaproteobacteria bacterium]